MDFTKLNGYEFEILMSNLFIKMGFQIETTSLTGDGGVDIILYLDKHIIGGKYLVQCKNWASPVGVPVIREMYGLVSSERVNKGIIITSSTFTKEAIKFSEGKNLELVNGPTVIDLLKEYNVVSDTVAVTTETNGITSITNFDKDKYIYLKKRIEENRSDLLSYVEMRRFYHNYFISNCSDKNIGYLYDSYIELNNEILSRFYKKGIKYTDEQRILNFINCYIYMLKGELYKSVDIALRTGFFNKHISIHFGESKHYNPSKEEVPRNCSPYLGVSNYYRLLTAYYIIFHVYKFKEGKGYIREMLNYQKKTIKEVQEDIKSKSRNKLQYILSSRTAPKDLLTALKIDCAENISILKSIDNNTFSSISLPHISKDKYIYKYDSEFYITKDILKNNYKDIDIAEDLRKIKYLLNLS
ncbi:restriction endonuclease [Alloiococcus sp. CFN-8]|uniref:restriction endonuclease n=1 Tax=Alloiococcus sp. CFN-8 TaxID=3416081 RepID=UPI003CE82ED7